MPTIPDALAQKSGGRENGGSPGASGAPGGDPLRPTAATFFAPAAPVTYRFTGRKLINTPVLIAYENEALISVVRTRTDELAFACKLYHDGLFVGSVRGDTIFPSQGAAVARYKLESTAHGRRLLNLTTGQAVISLIRQGPRSPYEVTLWYILPDRSPVVATPALLMIGGKSVKADSFDGAEAAIAIRCTTKYRRAGVILS